MDKEVNIDGLNVSYCDEGEGKVLLLFHGWGANKEAFTPIIKRMSKTMRVVALDFPGFGGSDEPKAVWDIEKYAEFANKFIDELNLGGAVWLAHSFGGRCVIKLYGMVKEKPEKIVLVDSAGIKPRRKAGYYVKVYSYKAGKKLLSLPLINKTGLYEKLVKNAGSSDYKNLSDVMRGTMSKVVNEDLRGYLHEIKCPVLLIWGDKDTATPIGDAEIMNSLLPDSGIVTLEGAGHFSYLDRPAKFYAALEYFVK
ncbi:MAG: alpha/beta hydrolase [Clostridia bacterium]|nr:alpha/beta hydrolase [Clostridia bacterium]